MKKSDLTSFMDGVQAKAEAHEAESRELLEGMTELKHTFKKQVHGIADKIVE